MKLLLDLRVKTGVDIVLQDRMTLATLTRRLRHNDQAQVQHAVDYWISAGIFHSDADGSIVLLEESPDGENDQDAGGSMRVFIFLILIAPLTEVYISLYANSAVEDAIDLESVEDIQQDLHEKHWPVSLVLCLYAELSARFLLRRECRKYKVRGNVTLSQHGS